MVTSSKYDMKTREADTLRDAYAATNKEKNILESRNEALAKQVNDEKEANVSLAERVRTQEEELRRLGEELASARKSYEGTRITREQFINELLEKEKTTGKRIQELGSKAQECELSLDALRKEAAARETELAAMRKESGTHGENGDTVKRERDILAGRVERLTEERRLEEKRREERFTALADSIKKISAEVVVTSLGPVMHIQIPDKTLLAKARSPLSDTARKIVREVGKTAEEFPNSSVILHAGGKKIAEDLRDSLLGGTKIPAGRILLTSADREKGAALMLLVP